MFLFKKTRYSFIYFNKGGCEYFTQQSDTAIMLCYYKTFSII